MLDNRKEKIEGAREKKAEIERITAENEEYIQKQREFDIEVHEKKAKEQAQKIQSEGKKAIEAAQRKSLDEISDNSDEKLVPAQFAPSASNTQPWYFTHNDDGSYDLYRVKLGRLRNRFYKKWNKIDTGIALAHLYVANKDSFRFYMKDNPEESKGLFYAGSFEI